MPDTLSLPAYVAAQGFRSPSFLLRTQIAEESAFCNTKKRPSQRNDFLFVLEKVGLGLFGYMLRSFATSPLSHTLSFHCGRGQCLY